MVATTIRIFQNECGCSLESVIIRNSEGLIVGAASHSIDLNFDPVIQEILAICGCLRFASSLSCPNLIIESDRKQTINLIQGVDFWLSTADCWIEEIKIWVRSSIQSPSPFVTVNVIMWLIE